MFGLDDRVALVTGAARGVGAAIARRLADAGARVVVSDVLDDEGERTAEAIGEAARYEALDVRDEDAWARVVDSIVEREGRLDVLVNNAAILHLGSVENTPAETFRSVLEVNTVGPFLGTRAVVPAMKARGGGSIVHVASIDGLVGMNGVSAYCASKFGLRGLARATALELGRSGIRVNAVCAAGGNAEMYGGWLPKMAELADSIGHYQDNRAIPGSPSLDAIARAVLYLASDASEGITGIDLPVDHGATAGKYLEGFDRL